MRNWLKEKTVILTGASGGIGRELAKILILRYGARVIGIGRREEKMRSLQAELENSAGNFEYYLFDVSKRENWENFAQTLKEKEEQPILLVNNAGAFPVFERALNTDVETIEKILSNNYLSATYACKALKDVLMGTEKDKPAIVNVCSSAALCTVSGTSAYSASKAALKAYTEALQMEEKGKLYVGGVYPGTTKTELFRGDKQTENSALDIIAMPARKMAKKIAKSILRKRKRAVLGWDAKLMNWTAKIAPVKGLFLIRGVMKASGSKVFSRVFDKKHK